MLSNVNVETVCYLIVKAREFDVKMAPETPDPGSNPVDDLDREILFDYPDDPTTQEVRDCIEGLDAGASAEVLALVLLGRGDFTDWQSALTAARDNPEESTARALMSIPLLSTYLEEGLSQIGYDCADVEAAHL